MSRAAQQGISLIEIMVAVAIIGVMFALGMPAYSTWIQNTQIRTAAEAILNGLQAAKNEAIQRNATVQFQITGATTTTWKVNLASDPDGVPLRSRMAEEGSPNATVTFTPGGANTVTFSSLGRVVPNVDASPSIMQVDIDNPTIAVVADRRVLRIIIPAGGAIRLCDPNPNVGPTDPRRCQP